MSEYDEQLPSYDEALEESVSCSAAGHRTAQQVPSPSMTLSQTSAGSSITNTLSLPLYSAKTPSPPLYARNDPAAQIFIFRPPLIYSTTSSTNSPSTDELSGPPSALTPRYQLAQRLTRSGKPYQLRLRPLVPSESRRLSLASAATAATSASSQAPSSPKPLDSSPISPTNNASAIPFDDDTTLYVIDSMHHLGTARTEVQSPRSGRSTRVLPGVVRIEPTPPPPPPAVARSAGPSRPKPKSLAACRFWHMRRNPARDALRAENEARMQRRGYHERDEWTRVLLFAVSPGGNSGGDTPGTRRKGSSSGAALALGLVGRGQGSWEWRDWEGRIVAVERERSGRLEIVDGEQMAARTREVLVACWVGRCWCSGRWEWEGES